MSKRFWLIIVRQVSSGRRYTYPIMEGRRQGDPEVPDHDVRSVRKGAKAGPAEAGIEQRAVMLKQDRRCSKPSSTRFRHPSSIRCSMRNDPVTATTRRITTTVVVNDWRRRGALMSSLL
jgi:hypothetical protein